MRSEQELNSGVSLKALATNAVHGVKIERETQMTLVLRSEILNSSLKQPGVHKKADRITSTELGHAKFLPCGFLVICCLLRVIQTED